MSSALFQGRRVLWTSFTDPIDVRGPGPHCCAAMDQALTFDCRQHESPFDCADHLVVFNALFEEYGLIVHDGGPSYVLISHCPWCGAALPGSRRDAYFERLEREGRNIDDESLPDRFRKPGWWCETDAPRS